MAAKLLRQDTDGEPFVELSTHDSSKEAWTEAAAQAAARGESLDRYLVQDFVGEAPE